MNPKGPDSPEFIAAKGVGNVAELAVAAYYRNRACDTMQALGQCPYDLELRMRLEVKRDLKAPTSGNVAIEVSCNGKPSGITTTTAHQWVFVVEKVGYMVRTEQLRNLLDTENFPTRSAGDGKRARVRLVPLRTLQQLDVVRFDLSEYLP